MITRLIIENFKGFERIDVPLGPLNVLIGPNASGKSNFLEALRVLQGLAMGLPLGQILDDRTDDDRITGFPGVRGGAAHAVRKGAGDEFTLDVYWSAKSRSHSADEGHEITRAYRYLVTVNCSTLRIERESFWHLPRESPARLIQGRILSRKRQHTGLDQTETLGRVPVDAALLDLVAFDSEHSAYDLLAVRELASQTHLDPLPRVLRRYARLSDRVALGDDGDSFAAVVDGIVRNPEAKQVFLSWLGTLRPEEISDVAALPGADPKHRLFALKEARESHEAWTYAASLSDGTLRFAAILAACLQARPPALLAIEEADTGIHAERLRVLVDLLTTMSRGQGIQTIVTTHAPRVLDWLDAEQLNHALWFRRREDGASDIKVVGTDPSVQALLQAGESIGDLYAEGWMESAL